MKTLYKIDLQDKKALQKYEDLLRHRFVRFGYRLSKSKTIQAGPQHIKLRQVPIRKGFRITDKESGAVVAGQNYDLSIQDAENFWIDEHNRRDAEKRQKRRQEEAERLATKKRPKTVKIDDRWIVTNDARAISALNDHISKYGSFDTNGHGAGGNAATVMYQAYRPYACPKFGQVWPIDGDWSNLTDYNLRSDADEVTLPDGVVPITTQRRIWHDGLRFFIKLPIHDQVFFTKWNRDLFNVLSMHKVLSGWYIQRQDRETKTVLRLYCRVNGKIISFAEIVALFDAGKVDLNDIPGSLSAGKKWIHDNQKQVDHLRDNTANNNAHNLSIMPKSKNNGKSDMVTEITAPFAFIPARIGEDYRILLGKFAGSNKYSRCVICHGTGQFLECLRAFYKIAKASGEMLPRTKDHAKTACISQMLWDDGMEYHEGQYNPIEWLLRADESDFTPWNGNESLLYPDGG